MKKTLTVNLGGSVYHIDEDAYRLLDDYLCNLRLHFRKQEGADEIVNDIETRISELFSEKVMLNTQVITVVDVEEIIGRMGKPEEFEGGGYTAYEEVSGEGSASGDKGNGRTGRKLYRNPDDKVLGGVLSGIAAFFGWDPTPLRLVTSLVLIFGVGSLIPIYIVLWIVIPEARTAAEKLNMRGEDVTVENIGKTVTDGFEKMTDGVKDYVNSGKPRTLVQKLADTFVAIIGFILKAFLVVLAIVFSPLILVLLFVLVLLIVVVVAIMIGGGTALYNLIPSVDWSYISASPIVTVVACIAGVIIIGVPLFGIVFSILRAVFKWQPMIPGLKWALLILWLVGVILFCFTYPELNWYLNEFQMAYL